MIHRRRWIQEVRDSSSSVFEYKKQVKFTPIQRSSNGIFRKIELKDFSVQRKMRSWKTTSSGRKYRILFESLEFWDAINIRGHVREREGKGAHVFIFVAVGWWVETYKFYQVRNRKEFEGQNFWEPLKNHPTRGLSWRRWRRCVYAEAPKNLKKTILL